MWLVVDAPLPVIAVHAVHPAPLPTRGFWRYCHPVTSESFRLFQRSRMLLFVSEPPCPAAVKPLGFAAPAMGVTESERSEFGLSPAAFTARTLKR